MRESARIVSENGLQDGELLALIAQRDDSALAGLYDRHASKAFGLACAICRNPADAEEIVFDTFGQVWRTAGSYDPARGPVAGWILTITRSRALDFVRTRQRQLRLMEESAAGEEEGLALPLAPAANASDAAEQAELQTAVVRTLAQLPEPQREVIELAYFRGLSQSEIAAALGAPLGTVKTRMRTAMEKLRQALAPLAAELRP